MEAGIGPEDIKLGLGDTLLLEIYQRGDLAAAYGFRVGEQGFNIPDFVLEIFVQIPGQHFLFDNCGTADALESFPYLFHFTFRQCAVQGKNLLGPFIAGEIPASGKKDMP